MSESGDRAGSSGERGRFLMMNLLHKYYWFDEALNGNLLRKGWPNITPAQSLVMIHIALGMNRASTIARDLGVSRQAMSQMLGEMKSMGLITFAPDPHDKRAQLVLFAPEAEAIRTDAVSMLENVETVLAERIGKRTLESLRAALSKDWGAPPDFSDPTGGSDDGRGTRAPARRRQVR